MSSKIELSPTMQKATCTQIIKIVKPCLMRVVTTIMCRRRNDELKTQVQQFMRVEGVRALAA